jgi:AcrR family transcriptional regulator
MKEGELTKKENTHQLIIEKAAQLFNSKGYAATSIADIMEATGLQKGGIYSHFKSKNEIEVAAFNYLLTQLSHKISGYNKKCY